MPEPIAPVTGIARAGLGTATNLEETQHYTLEDLGATNPEPLLDDPAVPESSPTIAFVPASVKQAGSRVRHTGSGIPRHVLAMGAAAILMLAIALTVRDGPIGGPGVFGGLFGDPGAGTSPKPTVKAPAPTKAPEAGGKGHGHGNGNGHGGGGDGH